MGLATSRLPFMRTPKMGRTRHARHGVRHGRRAADAVLAALLWLGAAVLWVTNGPAPTPRRGCGSLFMIVQSLPLCGRRLWSPWVNALGADAGMPGPCSKRPAGGPHEPGPAMQPAQ